MNHEKHFLGHITAYILEISKTAFKESFIGLL